MPKIDGDLVPPRKKIGIKWNRGHPRQIAAAQFNSASKTPNRASPIFFALKKKFSRNFIFYPRGSKFCQDTWSVKNLSSPIFYFFEKKIFFFTKNKQDGVRRRKVYRADDLHLNWRLRFNFSTKTFFQWKKNRNLRKIIGPQCMICNPKRNQEATKQAWKVAWAPNWAIFSNILGAFSNKRSSTLPAMHP